LITGGAKGMGAAITKMCAQEGAFPVVVDRDAEACERLDEDLKNNGLQAGFVHVDLSAAENCNMALS
jgi:L-fucose dehydrogenase